ncbi:unnamed protein product, partial [Brenthis ino]
MKSFFVFCVLKIITALVSNAQKTNDEIPERHKKHAADRDILKDQSFIFSGDRPIPYMMQTPMKHQNYNHGNSKHENKVERRKMIIENNLPYNNLEVVRNDLANVETGTGQRRRNSNSNSGININNNVSNNKESVEINNIQQENKKSDSRLKANFIESINSYLQNNYPDQKLDSDNIFQEFIENEESANANNDVNINNNVNNNTQKVQINNVQQKNELNRRRMNINSKLNAKLSKKNIGNSYLETNKESQSSVINSLPFNGHTRRNVNSNVNSAVNINNDVYDNLEKIELDNIQQKNEQSKRIMDLQSALNAQISPKNNKNTTLNTDLSKENEQEVDLLALISPKKNLQEKINLNINKKLNINNNLNHNVQKVVISNINQKNKDNIKKMNVQSILSYFSYFIDHPPKDKDLNALKRKKETYITMLNYFIKYLEEMGVPDSEILYYIELAQSYESDAEIREKYNKLIHSYQHPSQTTDIDDIITETPVIIVHNRPEEVNPDESNPEDGGNIRDKNIQLILNSFNYLLHNSPKDEDLNALRQKKKTYLLELIDYIKYLKANGVPNLKILWYLQEAQKYESDEELKEKYNKLILIYQNPSRNPDIDDIISESPVIIVPNRPEEVNPDESNPEEWGNIRDKNIQLILNNFDHLLHNSPKDDDLSALRQKKKTYLLELIDYIKYLEANGVPDLKILWYLQEAQKYESDEELKEKYNKLILIYQNPSRNPDIDDIISESPVIIVPNRPEEVNPDESNPEEWGNIRDKNIQLILNNFDHLLHNSPKDEDLNALRQKKKTYLLELIDYIKYLKANGVPNLKILWYLQEAEKYESDEELKEKYNKLILIYQNPSRNPDIDDIISESPVIIVPNRPEEVNPDESNPEEWGNIRDKNIQLILNNFDHLLHNSPKDDDLSALRQKKKTYLLELIDYIKYLEANGVPDLKILWYLQEAQKYESDEELKEKYNKLILIYQNPSRNPDIDDIISESPVIIVPNRPEEVNPDESNPEEWGNIRDKNIQLILNNFDHLLHNSPKDDDLSALRQKKKTYLLELIDYIKYFKANGVPDLKILWYLQEAQKYESDEELREKYNQLIHFYQNPSQNLDIDEILSETPVIIVPNQPEEINPVESNPEDGENIIDENIQLILSKFDHFLHNSPKDEDPSALKQKKKIYLRKLIGFIKYLQVFGVPDLKIIWYLQEAQKYESDKELKVIYWQIINSYKQQQRDENKEPSPPSDEILPNNSIEEIDETTPHWKPEDIPPPHPESENTPPPHSESENIPPPFWAPENEPTPPPPYWKPENTPPPHSESENIPPPFWTPENEPTPPPPYWKPENTPPPHSESENIPPPFWAPENEPTPPPPYWKPENTPPPCWAPENEPTPPSTEIPDEVKPNILDLLKPPYNVHHNKYIDDIITHLIEHLKRNGVSDEEIQKIVQISLINVINSMTHYTII